MPALVATDGFGAMSMKSPLLSMTQPLQLFMLTYSHKTSSLLAMLTNTY
jgi:hypothetical protein